MRQQPNVSVCLIKGYYVKLRRGRKRRGPCSFQVTNEPQQDDVPSWGFKK